MDGGVPPSAFRPTLEDSTEGGMVVEFAGRHGGSKRQDSLGCRLRHRSLLRNAVLGG